MPEGATIVDDGAPSTRGVYGRIPGRDPHVWANVAIRAGHPADDADKGSVIGKGRRGRRRRGSPLLVAEWLASGRLRVALPEETFPPRAVVERVGGWERLREIPAGGDGRAGGAGSRGRAGAPGPWSLDDAGHLVRGKKVVAAALAILSSVAA